MAIARSHRYRIGALRAQKLHRVLKRLSGGVETALLEREG
jgi:hypothetical protein